MSYDSGWGHGGQGAGVQSIYSAAGETGLWDAVQTEYDDDYLVVG